MIILGVETSCDETAISVVEAEGVLEAPRFRVLGSSLQSQVKLHAEYGGVFPILAKREHIKNLPIVYREALVNAQIEEDKIEMISVTVGPGLEPALWTGIKFAEDLGQKLGVKVVAANHMLGHAASVLFPKSNEFSNIKIGFPAIALLISGGHTEIILFKSWVDKLKVGETQDDAVGEAFDKVARMLGLPYPGGPQISTLAEEGRNSNIETLNVRFPRPMIHSKDLNFSFSGLKTAVLYYLRDNPKADKIEVAREFEDAVIETLLSKTKKALEMYSPKTLIIGGGVIANKALRENFLRLTATYPDLQILIPEKELTTDNATMIAAAGYIKYLQNKSQDKSKISAPLKADGNLQI